MFSLSSNLDCTKVLQSDSTGRPDVVCVSILILTWSSFVLLYFDFWTTSVHGSFDDSSHFVHVNINILTHTTSGPPAVMNLSVF